MSSTIFYTSRSGATLSLGHDGDAGIDLPTAEKWTIAQYDWTNVPIDIQVELPTGVWGMILGRSSTFFNKHLMVNQAVIDNGYRGELFVCVFNAGRHAYHVEEGERLAQLIPMLLVPCSLTRVNELAGSARGTDGFGSTG